MAGNGARPFGVTLVFIVILVSGVLAVVAGVWRLFNREDGVGWISAAVTIAIGLVYLLVARGIANGSRGARFLVALVTFLMIITSVWALFVSPGLWLTIAVQIALGLIVLGLLYSARAKQFFGA
jgi:hypothetical protein